jgi:caffeoyl-CoA O-methyltransferase
MTQTTGVLDERMYQYLLDFGTREESLLKQLREETSRDPMARMQISPEQGQFMKMLVWLLNPKSILEIGTFTGYSSLCMALASQEDCKIVTCDMDETWTKTANRYWSEAGVDDKVELKLGDAMDSIRALLESTGGESFDLIFLDADKENYPNYYPRLKQLLKPGGLMLIDNVFWSGKVADPTDTSEPTAGVRELNRLLLEDAEMDISMIPLSDGLTLARRSI